MDNMNEYGLDFDPDMSEGTMPDAKNIMEDKMDKMEFEILGDPKSQQRQEQGFEV